MHYKVLNLDKMNFDCYHQWSMAILLYHYLVHTKIISIQFKGGLFDISSLSILDKYLNIFSKLLFTQVRFIGGYFQRAEKENISLCMHTRVFPRNRKPLKTRPGFSFC